MNFDELATLINLNSYTKNKAGVDDNMVIFSKWMTELGYQIERHPREQIGDHIHYLSQKKDGKKVLLLGHSDTVFPPNTFTDFSEDDEWIYGPGVCDMKGGNYVALQALRNIHSASGSIHNIDMLIVSDEETGSDDSKALTKEIAKDYDLCLVFEAAGPDHDVVIARKGVATFFIQIEGKGAHAGNHYVDGINANLEAAHLLIALTALTDLEKGTTVNAGKMRGGLGANTISPQAELVVETRFTQQSEWQRLKSAMENIQQFSQVEGTKISVTGGLQRDVMEYDDKQQALVNEIEQILGQPLTLERRGGVSDANVVSGAGTPALDGWGPFGDGDHTVHERALKSSFTRRINEVTQILSHYNGQ